MVYWGSNSDQIYYLHFCVKYLKHYRFSNHTMENHLVVLKLTFLHLCRNVLNLKTFFEQIIMFSCLSFGHGLKARITIQNINGIGNVKNQLFFMTLHAHLFKVYLSCD
jgi:hypothetical protein